MALLSLSQVREHYDTDLEADPIQRFLDDAESEIVKIFGAHVTQVDWLSGGETHLFLTRPASSITSIVETVAATDTTLAADDHELQHNGRSLERQSDGTNGRTRWGDKIKVTYVPVDDQDQRKRVQLDLVKLAIQFDGLRRSTVGNQNLEMGDYEARRNAILSSLAPTMGFV